MAKPKKFEKEGYEGIWRPENHTIDIFQLYKTKTILMDGTEGGETTYLDLIESKQFTNKNLAENFFLKYKK